VRKALKSLPWVRQVRVNFDKKKAVVTVEAGKYNEKALLKALKKAGYRGKVLK
jgi:copper chaperone CopZ